MTHFSARREPHTPGEIAPGRHALGLARAWIHRRACRRLTPPPPLQVDRATADKICSFNRRFAERAGYFLQTSFVDDLDAAVEQGGATLPLTFFDSVTGKPLFRAPQGRSVDQFLAESNTHGWPSFRDSEVVWDNVRILRDGEAVSVDGTHLGHNLPDRTGNRYCINLVSVAGRPV